LEIAFDKISKYLQYFKVSCRFEFTNLKCTSFHKVHSEFEYCFLKSINRTYKYASLKLLLHQVPVEDCLIHISMQKRLNGYKPFLYNYTMDGCKFMKNPNPGDKVSKFFLSLFRPYSNINHSCPYNNDIIVDKVPISFMNYKLTKILPLPKGDFLITTSWTMKGIHCNDVDVYFSI
ncbi:hypothetical protein KR222_008224, partial [Zaprionus bogoriensis]